jgi:hypothetical protein
MEQYVISAEDKARMLALLAMAWDGQWFLKTYDEYGWEAAARLNARVRAAFGRIEMRRMLRALNKRTADDLADAARIIQIYFQQVLAAGFDADLAVRCGSHVGRTFRSASHVMEVTVTRCAALSGARRAGLERHDQACVACRGLWHAYLEVLLPDTPVDVEIVEQMGCGASRCQFVIRVGAAGRGR